MPACGKAGAADFFRIDSEFRGFGADGSDGALGILPGGDVLRDEFGARDTVADDDGGDAFFVKEIGDLNAFVLIAAALIGASWEDDDA